MELVTPGIGLIFWMTLSFSILLFILGKFAWKPIMTTLKEREQTIENALLSAEKAKEEMLSLQAGNELLLKQARDERDAMLTEARKIKDGIVNELDTQVQEYQLARGASYESFGAQNAVEAGYNSITGRLDNITAGKVKTEFGKYTPEQKELFAHCASIKKLEGDDDTFYRLLSKDITEEEARKLIESQKKKVTEKQV